MWFPGEITDRPHRGLCAGWRRGQLGGLITRRRRFDSCPRYQVWASGAARRKALLLGALAARLRGVAGCRKASGSRGWYPGSITAPVCFYPRCGYRPWPVFQPPRGDALSTLAEELRCRLCDYLYSDEEGCETCVPAKRTIVWPSDVTAGRSAEVVGWEVVKVLRRHLERIRKEERDLKHRGLSPQLVDAAVKIGNALTKLIAELRKMEDREREDVRNMSDEKKLRLLLDHVANLPRAVREQFLTEAVRMLQTGIEVLPSGRDRLPAAEPKE